MTEEIKDGGPIFPSKKESVLFKKGHEDCANKILAGIHPGISIRDYFASQALPIAMEASMRAPEVFLKETQEKNVSNEYLVASVAYRLADAMLEVRERKK